MIKIEIDASKLDAKVNPISYRLAYDWLFIDKQHKGQEWYIKKALNKGKCFNLNGEVVYVSEYEITFNPDEAIERLFGGFCHNMRPEYILMIINKELDSLKDIYNEVYQSAGVA